MALVELILIEVIVLLTVKSFVVIEFLLLIDVELNELVVILVEFCIYCDFKDVISKSVVFIEFVDVKELVIILLEQ